MGSSNAQKEAKTLIEDLMEDNPHLSDYNNKTYDDDKSIEETEPLKKVESDIINFDWSKAHQEHVNEAESSMIKIF